MAVLVLGGAGYIGSHTVYELIEQGREVVVADNLLTGFRQAVHPKAKFYYLDIRDGSKLDELFQNESIDGVIHFAASSQVGESMTDPLKYYNNNLWGTCSLLESMVNNDIKYIVFSSSAAVYGIPDNNPIQETDNTSPINPYGETKLAMEKMMQWSDRAYGTKHVALRYFNACGAHTNGQIGEAHDPETHLIPIVLQVPNGKREYIGVYGNDYSTKDGTCVRDYIHVLDLASAHILALDYLMSGNDSDVFNLGNGVGFSVKDIIDVAREVTDNPIPEKILERRVGDPDSLVASSKKAHDVLGWSPKYEDIKKIVSTAWNWHKTNPSGYNGR